MNKSSIILSVGILILAGAMLFLTTFQFQQVNAGSNVTIDGSQQIIDIKAKGGFSPRTTVAKAGMPTTLKITTNGTFDCSASLVIPELNYEKLLPSTGVTKIEVPSQEPGKTITGLCSMGMYSFTVKFE
jgi:plastocyanin domain-containing protein